jgi:hypothetical protein
MNEQELKSTLKLGIKSPSRDFTGKVMSDISLLPREEPIYNKWRVRVLFIACCVLVVLSIFVRLPKIEFFDHSIVFSPVILPIITLSFLFFVFQQLYDLSSKIIEPIDKYRA